jgi:protein CrcB
MLGFKQIAVVAFGGALGSIARYKLGGFVLHYGSSDFPTSTFSVNVLGCFLIGLLAALVEHHDLFSPSMRLFLFTGLLGGFTTFFGFWIRDRISHPSNNDINLAHICRLERSLWSCGCLCWAKSRRCDLATTPLIVKSRH